MMNLGPGNGENSLGNGRGRQFQRHSLEQRQRLEEVFNNCPNPTKVLQQTLSEELNLELKQIKYWFQNRRTRRKNENDRANVDALKLENESLLEENKKLRTENVKLKQEHEKCPKAIDYVPANLHSDSQLAITVIGSPFNALQAVSQHLVITPDKSDIVADLARKMSRSFWEHLSVAGKFDFPHLPYVSSNDVRVAVRFNDVPGVPSRFVLGASSSLLLDVSHVTLCDFFDNYQTRFQWDLCTDESSTKVIEDIYLRTDPGPRVSLYQASSRSENSMFILQENSNTPQGTVIVYAPIHPEWVRSVFSGRMTPSYMPLLPAGFLISGDVSSEKSAVGASSSSSTRMPGRSLLSMFYQMFAGSASDTKASMESVATLKGFVASTMQRIQAALSG